MNDAVGKPSQNVENSMLVSRENVGKVRAIENVFQSRQDSDPDMRTILGRNKSTTEKVHEPDPDWQRRKEELASGRHAEKPCGAHEGKQLQCRSRGSDPERKERQAKEHGVLQVGESPMVLLQVSQAIPKVEGRLQARDVLAAMRRVGLCPGTPASVAGGETVEKRQVDVLREERRQLGLSRSKIHRICVFLFTICPKKIDVQGK